MTTAMKIFPIPQCSYIDMCIVCVCVCYFMGTKCVSVFVSMICVCCLYRNKSQKTKFDEELHDKMTTTINDLSSSKLVLTSMLNHFGWN